MKTAALEYKIQYKYTDVIKTSRKTIAPVQFRKPGSLQRRRIKKKLSLKIGVKKTYHGHQEEIISF